MWDGIYRVMCSTEVRHDDVKNRTVLEGIELARSLAETFFPGDQVNEDDTNHSTIRNKETLVNTKLLLDHQP